MDPKKMASFAFVFLLAIPPVLSADASDGALAADGRTKSTAFQETLTLGYQDTAVRLINSNISVFEFVNAGDGYSISLMQGDYVKSILHERIGTGEGQFIDNWPSSGIVDMGASSVNVKIQKQNEASNIALHITKISKLDAEFYLVISVRSHGILQEVYYRYNVIYKAPTEEISINFAEAVIPVSGTFTARGTMKINGVTQDLSKFRFYVTGLYRGLTVQDGLAVAGCVDDTDPRWISKSSMAVDILVSDLESKQNYLAKSTLAYKFDRTYQNIEFALREGGNVRLTHESAERSVAVLANSDLTLILDKGTNATVVFEGENGLERTFVLSTEINSAEHGLTTSGAGKYDILLRQLDGSVDQISINVIATLVPVNKIQVTCASL